MLKSRELCARCAEPTVSDWLKPFKTSDTVSQLACEATRASSAMSWSASAFLRPSAQLLAAATALRDEGHIVHAGQMAYAALMHANTRGSEETTHGKLLEPQFSLSQPDLEKATRLFADAMLSTLPTMQASSARQVPNPAPRSLVGREWQSKSTAGPRRTLIHEAE